MDFASACAMIDRLILCSDMTRYRIFLEQRGFMHVTSRFSISFAYQIPRGRVRRGAQSPTSSRTVSFQGLISTLGCRQWKGITDPDPDPG